MPSYKKTRIPWYDGLAFSNVDNMLPFDPLVAFVLTHLTTISCATPIIAATSSLTTRDKECSNAPGTKAGTYVALHPTLPQRIYINRNPHIQPSRPAHPPTRSFAPS